MFCIRKRDKAISPALQINYHAVSCQTSEIIVMSAVTLSERIFPHSSGPSRIVIRVNEVVAMRNSGDSERMSTIALETKPLKMWGNERRKCKANCVHITKRALSVEKIDKCIAIVV